MSYRPICDTWYLARSKVKYYGAYPAGFLERARALLGVHINDPVLHVCGGRVSEYPYAGGFGPNDKTVDVDGTLHPDFVIDITTSALPPYADRWADDETPWYAVLADPPYTEADAQQYGNAPLPSARLCLERGLDVVDEGARVGVLHVQPPRPPKGTKYIAQVSVYVGFENIVRSYAVYEKR